MPTQVSKPGSLCSLYEERMGAMKRKGDRVNVTPQVFNYRH
jgi:hypothetical protein